MESLPAETFRVTDRAPAATNAAGLGPSRAFRGGGPLVPSESLSLRCPGGAAYDYDHEKETEGFRLDHPDAAFAAFR